MVRMGTELTFTSFYAFIIKFKEATKWAGDKNWCYYWASGLREVKGPNEVSWQERTAPIQAALAEPQYLRVNSAGAKLPSRE